MELIQATVGIVGAGPLGLELAIALKLAKVHYIQFDKGQIAQMIENFPPQTHFFSSSDKIGIAGIPIQTVDQQKCTREAYLAYIRSVAMRYELQVQTHVTVTHVKRLPEGGFRVTTNDGNHAQEYEFSYLVLATGGTSFSRTLGVPGEALSHVTTKMSDPHQYFRKKVIIVGARNSAAETALRCFHAGAYPILVTLANDLSPEKIKYWILPELMNRINVGEIGWYRNTAVSEILTDSVRIRELTTNAIQCVPCDYVIKSIGFVADMTLCQQLGVPLSAEDDMPEHNPDTMETMIPGLYLLGTIVGGTQLKYRIYIENTHIHVEKIAKALSIHIGTDIPVTKNGFYFGASTRLEE